MATASKRAFFALLFLLPTACRTQSTESEVKQVFSDARRSLVSPSSYPYIMSIDKGCTAFIIDKINLIGITADHCGPKVESRLCWADSGILQSSCSNEARLTQILETGVEPQLDYVIFKFEFIGQKPQNLAQVKLAGRNQINEAFTQRTPLAMIGFPGDEIQRGQLTRSECTVRQPRIAPQEKYWIDIVSDSTTKAPSEYDKWLQSTHDEIKGFWETQNMKSHPDFERMLKECGFAPSTNTTVVDYKDLARPSFVTDCSVYGGNSGGPVIIAHTGVVIGMPGTYQPKEYVALQCTTNATTSGESFWDAFFKPYYKTEIPFQNYDQWNKLDRTSRVLTDYPMTIAMHLIVQNSAFLRANPQYVSQNIFAP